jgi:hypothetical protein
VLETASAGIRGALGWWRSLSTLLRDVIGTAVFAVVAFLPLLAAEGTECPWGSAQNPALKSAYAVLGSRRQPIRPSATVIIALRIVPRFRPGRSAGYRRMRPGLSGSRGTPAGRPLGGRPRLAVGYRRRSNPRNLREIWWALSGARAR